jgi:predicted HicB family RNase H-like nuclease
MKSVNRTFRLDEDLLKTIHELAHHKNVSMNEFVADAIRAAVAPVHKKRK